MAAPLTDNERTEIIDLLATGASANTIARQTGRAISTISAIAKTVGHVFAQSNLAHAHEARSAYCAERRAVIAATLTEAAEKLLTELDGEYLVFNFGGRDNTYAEHLLVVPPADVKRQIMATVRDAMRTVLDIDARDNPATDDGDAGLGTDQQRALLAVVSGVIDVAPVEGRAAIMEALNGNEPP